MQVCGGKTPAEMDKLLNAFSWHNYNIRVSGCQRVRQNKLELLEKSDTAYRIISMPFKRLPKMYIYDLYPEQDGNIWLCTSLGVFNYNRNKEIKKQVDQQVICGNDP